MNYNQVESILLAHGLKRHENSEGAHFIFTKGKNHRIIFERLKRQKMAKLAGIFMQLYLKIISPDCSVNGHICLSKMKDENEFVYLLERVIEYFETVY